MYILATTDYFSKWAEAVPLKELKKKNVVDFIKSNIIFRCGIPRCIVIDNGTPFNNKLMSTLCKKFNFKQHKSSLYNAPANGLAEAFNKTLGNLLKKVVAKNKRTGMRGSVKLCGHIVRPVELLPKRLQLEALDEKRLEAQQKLECYQARLARSFNKRVRPQLFQVGKLVLAV
ncbi:uncharacterized protein LOC124887174 [Capsicum annuum]|uniref:uncharacterized protein LOC124887174 n=1 Tax=Capsicum annuum TaxID=4072 RepID=UPI001FB09659|nr:uncharacterized protein LOC124887174 [Capsicum annuum]